MVMKLTLVMRAMVLMIVLLVMHQTLIVVGIVPVMMMDQKKMAHSQMEEVRMMKHQMY
jgi:hypothetical protein